jgi:3-methyladenine DNA glycosylase AlkD
MAEQHDSMESKFTTQFFKDLKHLLDSKQKKIDELEKKLAEAVELVGCECHLSNWQKKCSGCRFIESLDEKEAQGE